MRSILTLVVVAGSISACATTAEVQIVASRATTTSSSIAAPAPPEPEDSVEATTTTVPPPLTSALDDIALTDVVDVGDEREPRPDDDLVAAAVVDIESWASDVLVNTYGLDDAPAQGGIYAGYPGRVDPLPGCGTAETEYRDLADYVALYCPGDEFIVYDDGPGGLLQSLVDENGGISVGVVLAHEFGHFIQDRAGLLDLDLATVTTEQHADCLAGAWMGRAARGDSSMLTVGPDGIRAGLIALVQVRDPAGIDTMSPGGHGTAFDRIGAFQTGVENGADACASLIDNPLPLMPNAYLSLDDYLRGGDAPYDCARDADPECLASWEFLGADLNEYWSIALGTPVSLEAFPVVSLAEACDDLRIVDGPIARCVDAQQVVFEAQTVRDLYAASGDFTLGYLLGLAWADLALESAGSSVRADPLQADCLVGAWVDDITLGSRRDPGRASTVVTSPGDPDEAIMMLIRLADDGGNSLFERVAAFRSGVLSGPNVCASQN
jgi:predicted metalloprotease